MFPARPKTSLRAGTSRLLELDLSHRSHSVEACGMNEEMIGIGGRVGHPRRVSSHPGRPQTQTQKTECMNVCVHIVCMSANVCACVQADDWQI